MNSIEQLTSRFFRKNGGAEKVIKGYDTLYVGVEAVDVSKCSREYQRLYSELAILVDEGAQIWHSIEDDPAGRVGEIARDAASISKRITATIRRMRSIAFGEAGWKRIDFDENEALATLRAHTEMREFLFQYDITSVEIGEHSPKHEKLYQDVNSLDVSKCAQIYKELHGQFLSTCDERRKCAAKMHEIRDGPIEDLRRQLKITKRLFHRGVALSEAISIINGMCEMQIQRDD